MADSSDASDSLDRCNVFVKYLPPDLTDDGLHALFQPFGDIISAKVMVDHISGNSLGYGCVSRRVASVCSRPSLTREYVATASFATPPSRRPSVRSRRCRRRRSAIRYA